MKWKDRLWENIVCCLPIENDFYLKLNSLTTENFHQHILSFKLAENSAPTLQEYFEYEGSRYPVFMNEFWTSKQRQANSLHEVSYRACFKPQLPGFFIQLFTKQGDWVYDPFNGRGTTNVEAALMGRNVIANDANPLSLLLTSPRIHLPTMEEIKIRLEAIDLTGEQKADIDLSMFYHPNTEKEIVALKTYLQNNSQSDRVDNWIQMVATNRLTGHSKGFFSVYTLPPNQAVTAERQKKINQSRNQNPEYRNVKELILRKSKQLLSGIDNTMRETLRSVQSVTLNGDASSTAAIKNNTVALTVTSPPFLDVVQYASDNWLRCWFNGIDVKAVEKKITMSKTVVEWSQKMQQVFNELYRITIHGGVVAFEVGEVRNGKVKLDETVVPLGLKAGFQCKGIIINQQSFTKTSNIWGVKNNNFGTNSNRIVVFQKN